MVRAVRATRKRLPGASFIWPKTRMARAKDAALLHFQPQVVAFAGALADAGEDGHAAVVVAHGADQLLKQDGLADAGAADQAGLAAARQRRQQVDDLDAGFQELQAAPLRRESWGGPMNRPALGLLERRTTVQRLAEHVEQPTQRLRPDRHPDRLPGALDRHAARQPFGVRHGDGPHGMRIRWWATSRMTVRSPSCTRRASLMAGSSPGKLDLDDRAPHGHHLAAHRIVAGCRCGDFVSCARWNYLHETPGAVAAFIPRKRRAQISKCKPWLPANTGRPGRFCTLMYRFRPRASGLGAAGGLPVFRSVARCSGVASHLGYYGRVDGHRWQPAQALRSRRSPKNWPPTSCSWLGASALSRINAESDRRHPRRVLSPDEFARLIDAAQHGKKVERIPGPDRAIVYVLAAWTGFRKGEIGSLTQRSLQLDAEPATATVEACYGNRGRTDTQILHPEVARRLRDWIATKPGLGLDAPLFPICGHPRWSRTQDQQDDETRLAGCPQEMDRRSEDRKRKRIEATVRLPHILQRCRPLRRLPLEPAPIRNDAGLYADFHSNRHLFVTALAGGRVAEGGPDVLPGTATSASLSDCTHTSSCMTSRRRSRRCRHRPWRARRSARRRSDASFSSSLIPEGGIGLATHQQLSLHTLLLGRARAPMTLPVDPRPNHRHIFVREPMRARPRDVLPLSRNDADERASGAVTGPD